MISICRLTTWRITGTRNSIYLANNESRALKPSAAKNWRGVSELMRGLAILRISPRVQTLFDSR